MRTNAEIHFLELVKANRVKIEEIEEVPYVAVYIDNTKRAINKIASKKKDYTDSVYHNHFTITLSKLIWMYRTNDYVPEKYQVVHLNFNKHDFKFDNLDIMTHQEHQNYMVSNGIYLAVSENTKNKRSEMAILNNPSAKLTREQVEYYRCQYHQRKMTINAIVEELKMQRKSVVNFLSFKAYSFDPITGEFDKELHNCYGEFKKYERKSSTCTPKKPKEIKVRIKNADGTSSMKPLSELPPKKIKDDFANAFRVMHTPLSFNDCRDLENYKFKRLYDYDKIALNTCLTVGVIKRHIGMYRFFIRIFPNHTLMEYDKVNELFKKFVDKYGNHFFESMSPNIKPYSFKMLINIQDSLLGEIYNEFKTGSSLEELSDEFDIPVHKLKLGIIEYDRYMRPKGLKGLTPYQFNSVYQ